MSVEDTEKRLVTRLHKLLKNTFWQEWLEASAEELQNIETNLDSIKSINKLEVVEEDRLVDIARKFGYNPNLVVDNSRDYIKREVESISYRIKNKSSLKGYLLLFKMIAETGRVFNIFYDGVKLVRAYSLPKTLLNLDSYVYGEVFSGVEPVLYLSSIVDSSVNLDMDGLTLDEDPPWYLDADLIRKTSQHLSIEYEIDRLFSLEGYPEAITSPDYLFYLEAGVDYNRKTTTVPHVGANLSLVTDYSGYYNFYNPSYDYSIPDIKASCCTTERFDRLFPLSNINYIVAGIGEKGVFDQKLGDIFSEKKLLYPFDEVRGTAVIDNSPSENNATIVGTTERVRGITSETVDFDGSTYVESNNLVSTTNDNKTLQFWFKFGILSTGDYLLFDNQFLKLWYDNTNGEFNITVTGSLTSLSFSFPYTHNTNEHLFSIEVDQSTGTLNVFEDTVLMLSNDISSIGNVSGTYPLKIGGGGILNYFNGIIDDFLIIDKIFSVDEKDYIYSNKLGSLTALNKPVYREKISVNEVYGQADWIIIQSHISSNFIAGDFIGIGNGSDTSFSGKTVESDIKPKTFKLEYISSSGEVYKGYDNGSGNILGEYYSGSVDYSTGDYTINTEREYVVEDEFVSNGNVSSISTMLVNNTIKEESFALYYQYVGTTETGVDDGLGNITGTNILSGSIDYSTGGVSVTFDNPVDSSDITASYVYTLRFIADSDTPIEAKYKLSKDLNITEVGIEDGENNLLCYGKHPPTVFGSDRYHLGVQFIINRDVI